jgi:hypothetical protein
MRFYFLRIEGEHLLNANWLVQTAINTDRTVCNAIQPMPIGPYKLRSTLIENAITDPGITSVMPMAGGCLTRKKTKRCLAVLV